jgi:adenylate cyclase
MAKKFNTISDLATQIRAEVETCFPTQFERTAARQVLQKKIEKVLAEGEFHDREPSMQRVTILLSDIRGFTAIAETYSATIVMDMLNRYFSVMTDVIIENSGTIDKLMGDSMMVLFGAPNTQEDDVERAIACAVGMQQAMSSFNEQNIAMGLPALFIGIGLNTGEVVAGSVGSQHHSEYTVIGDEVNLASRIEAQTLRGQILISENTYDLAREFVLVGKPNKVQVKGKRKPVSLFELMGTTKPRSMIVPRRETRKSPRIQVHMPCYFQRVEGKRVISNQYQADVVDVGYNGLLIDTPVPLVAHTEIKIEMSLQLLGTQTTDVYARVVNAERVGDSFQCSLEFTSIDMAGQQTIKRFVDNMVYQA